MLSYLKVYHIYMDYIIGTNLYSYQREIKNVIAFKVENFQVQDCNENDLKEKVI